jgi:hypothetical protein
LANSTLSALDSEIASLDAALAHAGTFAARIDRLRSVATLPLSEAALAAVQGAITEYDRELEALQAIRAKVETARATLHEARHAIASLRVGPTLPAREVSLAVVAEFAALVAELDGAVALFRAAAPEERAA